MAERDDDLVIQLALTEPRISAITAEKVGEALEGFRLAPVRSLGWITRAVQIYLFKSLTPADDGPARQENKVTRKELKGASDKLAKASKAIADLSGAADAAIFDYSWRIWRDPPSGVVASPPAYEEFRAAAAIVERLGLFLGDVAPTLERQKANWKRALEREERIRRGHYLSTVFEEAFAAEATVNNWEGAESLGPWADFYRRIVKMAFGEGAPPDLVGILKIARQRRKAARVVFDIGNPPN